MKKIILILSVLLLPCQVAADRGIVIDDDVCGSGNVLIQISNGMYIAAEYYAGVYLLKGDTVYGDLKTYGFGKLTRTDKETGEFFIQECQSDNFEEAVKILCK